MPDLPASKRLSSAQNDLETYAINHGYRTLAVLAHHRVGFDLDQHRRRHQPTDLDQRAGGPYIAEDLLVGPADLLPVVDVDDVDSRSHDVLQSGSRALESRCDVAQRLLRLFVGVGAVADKAGITGLVGNLVRLIARNRRLFTLPDIIKGFQAMLAAHRGEITADVTSARPLSDTQTSALKAAMKASLGKDVTIDSRIDPAILGGLIVKVGSRMIDSSIRTKLNFMKSRLKEAS